jgi:hypothetical protein
MNRKIFSACLSLISLLCLLVGCTSAINTTTFAEPAIPANYTTYTDEQGLFSISYPDDWEVITSLMQDAKAASDAVIKSINDNVPVEKVTAIFGAGLSDGFGYYAPFVNIGIEPMPILIRSNDQVAEAAVRGIKSIIKDYHELSRTKTQVDGREATIIEWEGTIPQDQSARNFQMYLLVGRNAWCVTCRVPPGETDNWKNDFNSIVRSLRIHK